MELVQDPSLIFLDEPTSGLDSFQAQNVVETLKVLCHHGATVILSIHQPRSSIFALFDHLILLSEGHVVYDGKGGQSSVEYFRDLGFQCPPLFNPADYFLDIVSVDNRSHDEEERSQRRIEYLTASFDEKQKLKQEVKSAESADDDSADTPATEWGETIQSAVWTQIQVLGTRTFRQLSRDRATLIIRLCTVCFFGLIIAVLYSETGSGQSVIQDRIGVLFFVTINQSFGAMFNTMNTFVVEKPIVMRERQTKSYHLASYYATKVLVAMPIDIVLPLLFCCIVYWIVGLNPDPTAFFTFCGITVTVSLAAVSIGFCIGSKASTVAAASAMGPPIMILQLMLAGFYINISSIPVWLRWLHNLSIIQWAFGAFMVNEFSGRTFDCDDPTSSVQCETTGEEVIDRMSFGDHAVWEDILYLFALTAAFHGVAFWILSGGTKYMKVAKAETKGSVALRVAASESRIR